MELREVHLCFRCVLMIQARLRCQQPMLSSVCWPLLGAEHELSPP